MTMVSSKSDWILVIWPAVEHLLDDWHAKRIEATKALGGLNQLFGSVSLGEPASDDSLQITQTRVIRALLESKKPDLSTVRAVFLAKSEPAVGQILSSYRSHPS